MLARLLTQPLLAERHIKQRGDAIVLPFGRSKSPKPTQVDWAAKYPCTRMHGADFEAQFYPASGDSL